MLYRLLLSLLIVISLANTVIIAQPRLTDDSTPAKVDEGSFSEQQKANVKVLDGMLDIIRRGFFDRQYRGKDLKEMRQRYLKRAADAKPGNELHNVLRELLAEFKVSHLGIVAQHAYDNHFAPEMDNTLRTQVGFDITELSPGEYFVTDILTGGPAEKAGLKRGDRLHKLMGKPLADHELLVDAGGDPGLPNQHPHYFIKNPPEGAPLVVEVQRTADSAERLTISIKPADINMIAASRNSVTIIEHEGRKLGYIRFWHFLHHGMSAALRRAITKEWQLCDGIIIDLRGRGGSPDVMNTCFAPFGEPPAMTRMPGGRATQRDYGMPKWERPVVALQDAGSRSAKEVYAHNWKWLKIGPLVGESTPGAVLGSTFAQLPDGSYLIYPAQNVRTLSYGQVELEGNPVEPTHPVKDNVRYAQGVDSIKEAGIKVLFDLVKDRPEPTLPKQESEAKEEEF